MKKIENKHCIDCGKLIGNLSIRCYSCANKGIHNPNYGKHPSAKTRKIKKKEIRTKGKIMVHQFSRNEKKNE